ncbi:hypothetical protein H696_01429 [Fonticula alba]|uniref:CYRIA/CYRIB Rac1 binding domain-containing protein n=1 Tax=Fonticula alba TaxID=691883 RepID=A0A058ZEX6_FONAL|nr:hypothetical protein H696_01429 [Fonticula alba]KCV72022.1 hypothetical protein H696_01429 [Fonticula alba]|eukprot:XP_009493600.1 hypothetical protein H696_01429 [Fonticula alba]
MGNLLSLRSRTAEHANLVQAASSSGAQLNLFLRPPPPESSDAMNIYSCTSEALDNFAGSLLDCLKIREFYHARNSNKTGAVSMISSDSDEDYLRLLNSARVVSTSVVDARSTADGILSILSFLSTGPNDTPAMLKETTAANFAAHPSLVRILADLIVSSMIFDSVKFDTPQLLNDMPLFRRTRVSRQKNPNATPIDDRIPGDDQIGLVSLFLGSPVPCLHLIQRTLVEGAGANVHGLLTALSLLAVICQLYLMEEDRPRSVDSDDPNATWLPVDHSELGKLIGHSAAPDHYALRLLVGSVLIYDHVAGESAALAGGAFDNSSGVSMRNVIRLVQQRAPTSEVANATPGLPPLTVDSLLASLRYFSRNSAHSPSILRLFPE